LLGSLLFHADLDLYSFVDDLAFTSPSPETKSDVGTYDYWDRKNYQPWTAQIEEKIGSEKED
jgi:hypothetical protein